MELILCEQSAFIVTTIAQTINTSIMGRKVEGSILLASCLSEERER